MKLAVHKIVIVLVALLSSQTMFSANPTPPPPTPPPVGLPIDGGLIVLFFAAIILGYIFSKKYIFTKKSSL